MPTLKCFWAGFLVESYTVMNRQEEKIQLEDLEHQIKTGSMKYLANGTTFILTELCVDAFEDEKFVAMHNFKL